MTGSVVDFGVLSGLFITMKQIKFYYRSDEYYPFTNWYHAPFTIGSYKYDTAVHWFESQKFKGTALETNIRQAESPKKAQRLGRSSAVAVDWDDMKYDVMKKGVTAKFTQNPKLGIMLTKTGGAHLVENSPTNYYWGIGDGTGKNFLGRILEEIRGAFNSHEIYFFRP